nr:hypothetical protein BaRGS_019504 [Batillaria attramentaria]
MIVQAVAFTHPGPHAILFVLSALNRYTEEEHKVYERVKALFDEEVTKYIILVFTHGDDLEDEDTTLDDLLKSAPPRMHEVLKECHGRYVLFNNKAKDKEPQVEVLLEEVRNLVRENGGPYQCPKYKPVGEGLEREIQRRVKEMEDRDPKLKAMEDKLREAEMAFQRLIEECEKLEEGKRDVQKMQAAEREVAELKKEKEKAKRRKYEEEMSNMRYKVARQPDDPSTANFLVRGLTSILNRLRGKRK